MFIELAIILNHSEDHHSNGTALPTNGSDSLLRQWLAPEIMLGQELLKSTWVGVILYGKWFCVALYWAAVLSCSIETLFGVALPIQELHLKVHWIVKCETPHNLYFALLSQSGRFPLTLFCLRRVGIYCTVCCRENPKNGSVLKISLTTNLLTWNTCPRQSVFLKQWAAHGTTVYNCPFNRENW